MAPKAIIVGAGAYGASLAYYLSRHSPPSSPWNVIVLDRSSDGQVAADAASYDVNKIIRSDYNDDNYRALGKEAITLWRDEANIWKRFYHESGVVFRSGWNERDSEKEKRKLASKKDMDYVQAGIRGASETKTQNGCGSKTSLAIHLDSPQKALSIFPESCREELGPGVLSIGAPPDEELEGRVNGNRDKSQQSSERTVQQDAYLNLNGGWAEAELATRATLQAAVDEGKGRVKVISGAHVSGLTSAEINGKTRVTGVKTSDGRLFELTPEELEDGQSAIVMCTGSWTRELIQDTSFLPHVARKQANQWPVTPSAQCVFTVQLPAELAAKYRGCPVTLNFNTGFYVFEPNQQGILKASIHSVGYQHPRPAAEPPSAEIPIMQPSFSKGFQSTAASGDGTSKHVADKVRQKVAAAERIHNGLDEAAPGQSLDSTAEEYIPESKLDEMLSELEQVYPELAHFARLNQQDGSVVKTRVCHYSDTLDENWIIDWLPGYDGLLVASGDSGHGFKFLPVLGRLIAARMQVSSPAIPPLTEHQASVFSFQHHFQLAHLAHVEKRDSNRYKPSSS